MRITKRRWWLGRTSALIAVAITVPFMAMAVIVAQDWFEQRHHHRKMGEALDVFEIGVALFQPLDTLRALSASSVHIDEQDVRRRYEQAQVDIDQRMAHFLLTLRALDSERISEQADLLEDTWNELHVQPGWDIEDISGPFDNVGLTIRELYQSLAAVLYGNRTQSLADLQVQDLMRPLLGTLGEVRHDVGTMTNVSVYSALRDGYLNSIDAEALDDSWLALSDTLQNLRNQLALRTEESLEESDVDTIIRSLDNLDLYLMRVENEIILASIIELDWHVCLDLGVAAFDNIAQLESLLLNRARAHQNRALGGIDFKYSMYLAGTALGYLLVLAFSLLVYRSNFIANQAREESIAKSNFLARMGHEIRTPMNGVLGLAELLRDTDPSERQKEYIELIESAGRSLVSLINDILDYAKIEAGKMDLEEMPFDLRTLIYESVHMFSLRADENNTLIFAHIDDNTPTQVRGDATRLRQVLINLISNAVKFTHNGHIEVISRCVDQEDGTIRVRFEVRDTGIGIPEKAREQIFSLFTQASSDVTRRFGGTGLGLAICREIMNLMGGEIGVAGREPDRGTLFWFEVPLHRDEHRQGQRDLPLNEHRSVAAPALLLDPTEQVSTFIRDYSAFDNVDSCGDLEQALALITAATDSGQPYSLMVVNTQDGNLDPRRITQAVRKRAPDIHIRLLAGVRESGHDTANIDGVNSAVNRSVFTLAHLVRLFDAAADSLHVLQASSGIQASDVLPDGLNVLVAEDNPVNQMVTVGFLKRIGVTHCDVANNGREAVDFFVKRKGDYDLVLMDLDMPELDGFDATRVIREREQQHGWRRATILALSAHALPQHARMVTEAGMDGQLVKPVTLRTLFAVLNQHLRK